MTSDSSDVLVNETFLKQLNIAGPEQALGQSLTHDGKSLRIVGVVKDFHAGTLKGDVPPVMMQKNPFVGMASLKLNPTGVRRTIGEIENVWKRAYPKSFFEFSFLDDTIAAFYREEVRTYKLFRIFSSMAVLLCCLGLYGLVSFMAVQRVKEIGVRRVLGASVFNIVSLFTKEFFLLIAVAYAVSAPIAWYVMNKWLQGFVYRIDIGAGVFLIAVLFSFLISGVTISYRALQAAFSTRNIH